jgi:hypothetical protein
MGRGLLPRRRLASIRSHSQRSARGRAGADASWLGPYGVRLQAGWGSRRDGGGPRGDCGDRPSGRDLRATTTATEGRGDASVVDVDARAPKHRWRGARSSTSSERVGPRLRRLPPDLLGRARATPQRGNDDRARRLRIDAGESPRTGRSRGRGGSTRATRERAATETTSSALKARPAIVQKHRRVYGICSHQAVDQRNCARTNRAAPDGHLVVRYAMHNQR